MYSTRTVSALSAEFQIKLPTRNALKACQLTEAGDCSGEPSLMLVASVLAAIRHAVAAARVDPARHLAASATASTDAAALNRSQDQPCSRKHAVRLGINAEAASDGAYGVQSPGGSLGPVFMENELQVQDGSFPGSFLGLDAPATVSRVRQAIGGPSIADMLRRAAGISRGRTSSGDGWELI